MERREQVFISSTYIDLVDERQEVIQTLLEADCIPAGMELFPASDDDRWTLIKRVIDDCDYYVIVIGGRYGSMDPDEGISYTEMEYDYAVQQGKPVMAFVHGNASNIPVGKTDQNDDARKKLEAFRDKVCQKVVKFWTTPQELGGQVAKSLIQTRKTHPAEGWVRASNAMTPETRQELAELRAKVAELTTELVTEHAQPSAVPAELLAQGADTVELEALMDYYPQEFVIEKDWTPRNRRRGYYVVEPSWDEVFAALAPSMMDEVSETALEEVLGKFISAHANEIEEQKDEPLGWFQAAEPVDKAFDDVRVQLFALGLVERSERKRQVSDYNTYWTLTKAGRDHMMRLRAIRKKDAVAGSPEGEASGDE